MSPPRRLRPVLEDDEPVELLREVIGILEAPLSERLAVVGAPILDGPRREIVEQPIVVGPVVLDARAMAMGLGDVDPTPLVDVERDGRALDERHVEVGDLEAFDELGLAFDDGADRRRVEHRTDHARDVDEGGVLGERELHPQRDAEPDRDRQDQQRDQEPSGDLPGSASLQREIPPRPDSIADRGLV